MPPKNPNQETLTGLIPVLTSSESEFDNLFLQKVLSCNNKGKSDSEPSAGQERGAMQQSGSIATASVIARTNSQGTVEDGDGSVRERLKRVRLEVAGRVWIPEIWGQEDLLKGWIDCSTFDAAVGGGRILSARAALVEEAARRRGDSGGFRIENSCRRR